MPSNRAALHVQRLRTYRMIRSSLRVASSPIVAASPSPDFHSDLNMPSRSAISPSGASESPTPRYPRKRVYGFGAISEPVSPRCSWHSASSAASSDLKASLPTPLVSPPGVSPPQSMWLLLSRKKDTPVLKLSSPPNPRPSTTSEPKPFELTTSALSST